MDAGLGEKVYRLLETRPRVLVNSLLESRSKWKEKCGVSKVELQAFRGKVRDLEVSREKWRIQAEESENLRRDLAQQLELAQARKKQLEKRLAASEAEKKNTASVELSRISLALHVTTAAQNSVPCMIFDEVDVGIGGGVAEVVGQLLKQLGSERQVLVITHLPQVAAQAAHHLQVSKTHANSATLSHIQALSQTERVEEIARMLGGIQITETTRSHAKEMLKI